jgi:hypothetical protein
MGFTIRCSMCALKGERVSLIREADTSKVVGHFIVGKRVDNL